MFQLSILKNKKVLFLEKIFLSCCQYLNKKALFTDQIFSEGFVSPIPQQNLNGKSEIVTYISFVNIGW